MSSKNTKYLTKGEETIVATTVSTSDLRQLLDERLAREVIVSIEVAVICSLGILSAFIWGSGDFLDTPGIVNPLFRGGVLLLILAGVLKTIPNK